MAPILGLARCRPVDRGPAVVLPAGSTSPSLIVAVGVLTSVLAILVAIAILYEVARRLGIPYPTLFVIGGAGLAFVPGLPRLRLEPDLVLLVFLPPLLFSAAFETSLRDLRANFGPISRLAIGLVLFTTGAVALVVHSAAPSVGWGAAFTLGAIVAPTDALAATAVFRRLGAPRVIVTLIEGEALLNDATALVTYRTAAAAVITGSFVLGDAAAGFIVAALGGIALGALVGQVLGELVRRLDDPPVEVAISLVIPFAAYLPADRLGTSGVLAAVTAGFVVGRRLGTILSPQSRVLWLSTWSMVGFILNGFAFVLIGLALPDIVAQLSPRSAGEVLLLVLLVCVTVVATRFGWVFLASLLPGTPRRRFAEHDPRLARWLVFIVSWSGLRGALSLAAALALPADFPDRNLILLLTFSVILVTLVGQGLTLPVLLNRIRWGGLVTEGDEPTLAREVAYDAGLAAIERGRSRWPTHQPLLDRLESGLRDRIQHLATQDPEETSERRIERSEHEEIQRSVIVAQRVAVIALRDDGRINDETLREIERELDLEELRMEG